MQPSYKTNRSVAIKVERLNSDETVIEEYTNVFIGGDVSVEEGIMRRKCTLEIASDFDFTWQASRWKIYYGIAPRVGVSPSEIVWYPQGVFIPMNPQLSETAWGEVSQYQGVDKSKILDDYEISEPMVFEYEEPIYDIVNGILDLVGESKRKITDTGHVVDTESGFTFEEGTTLLKILETLLEPLDVLFYYDVDGFAVFDYLQDPIEQPVKYKFDDNDGVRISSTIDVDDDEYFNRVTVIGGKADDEIYRSVRESSVAIANAGGRVVSKVFRVDGSADQYWNDYLAETYLRKGVQMPFMINIESLVIPDLQIGDIIEHKFVRYQVRSFNIPLGLASQSIKAGEVVY